MAQDIFGPGAHGAARAAAVRPAHTPGTGATDTWCQDCTSPTSRDGTEWRAAQMNAVIAQLRRQVRGNAVTENTADDEMLFRAGRSQRGNWLTVGGTANDLTLAPTPSFAALSDVVGVPLRFLTGAAANSGAMTLVVSALAAKAITWPDGTALAAGDMPAISVAEVVYDGTAFRLRNCMSPARVRVAAMKRSRVVFSSVGAASWVVPAGIEVCQVEMWGGGGSGASFSSTYRVGSGGAGGNYSMTVLAVTPGETLTVTVGAGGAAPAAGTNATGNAGSLSKIERAGSILLQAAGGTGGVWANTAYSNATLPAAIVGSGDVMRQGGTGVIGTLFDGVNGLGGGGGSGFIGGAGGSGSTGNATSGAAPGGGGGAGGNSGTSAGAGARGEVWIWY